MFDAIDRLNERNAKRLGAEIYDPPVIRSLNDIKSIIKKIFNTDITGAMIDIKATLNVDSKNVAASVSIKPKSMADHIVHGYTILRNRSQLPAAEPVLINGRNMNPAAVINTSMPWLDNILFRVLSAYRNGSLICWDIKDGYEYGYDPLTHYFGRSTRA